MPAVRRCRRERPPMDREQLSERLQLTVPASSLIPRQIDTQIEED